VFLGLAVIAAALASGCGSKGPDRPKTFAVTGTVTLDGQPVSGASVTFAPSGRGTPAIGTADASGRYALKSFGTQQGAVPGQYSVGIAKYDYGDTAGGSGGKGSAEMPANYDPNAPQGEGGKNTLPAKYESPATSGLAATVTEDASKNVFDFKLEGGGSAKK
jgi:hypothetical protein